MKMPQGEKTSPMYERIYGELRERIISGSYPHGSRLPSKRMLAEELGVSVITTAKAYELLSDEGYIVSRERSGYFVSYKPGDGHILPSAARPRALPPMHLSLGCVTETTLLPSAARSHPYPRSSRIFSHRNLKAHDAWRVTER